MNRDECKKLLMVINSTYPSFKVDNPTETLNMWSEFLADYEYEYIMQGLKIYVATSGSDYAPSISRLIGMARKPQELAQADEVSLWREVRPLISRGIYHAEEDFETLSPMAKRLVGDAGQLREWAMLESEVIDSVIQSNFKNRVATMQKRDTEFNAMPIEVQAMVQKTIGMKNN